MTGCEGPHPGPLNRVAPTLPPAGTNAAANPSTMPVGQRCGSTPAPTGDTYNETTRHEADAMGTTRFSWCNAERAGYPPLHIKITMFDLNTEERAETLLSPDQAFQMAQNILSMLSPEKIAREARAGHCETCGDTRLVSEERPGRAAPVTVRCPDCHYDDPAYPVEWKT